MTNLHGRASQGPAVRRGLYWVAFPQICSLFFTSGHEGIHPQQNHPLRYRGYVYDDETNLYYLQSRYYDPEMGRFINADALVSTGQGLLGNNMFAYCNNNPVIFCDPCGYCIHRWDFWNDCNRCGAKSIVDKLKNCISQITNYYNLQTEIESDIAIAQLQITTGYINNAKEVYSQQTEVQNKLKMIQTDVLRDGASVAYDVCMQAYSIHQEAQLQNGAMLLEGAKYFVEHPKKAETLLRDMGATSVAIATATSICLAGGPAGAVVGAIGAASFAVWDVSWTIGDILSDIQ